MKKIVVQDKYTGTKYVDRDVVKMLETNGSYLPPVSKVLFNLKTEAKVKETVKADDGSETTRMVTKPCDPILTTKVWWADGTSTTVKNTGNDKITLIEKEVDGKMIQIASEESKTIGLVYACVKRTCGVPGPKGEMVETNFGRILSNIVKNAHDQRLEAAKTAAAERKRKAKLAETKAKPVAKKTKRYSIKDLVQMMGPLLESLTNGVKPEAVITALPKESTAKILDLLSEEIKKSQEGA